MYDNDQFNVPNVSTTLKHEFNSTQRKGQVIVEALNGLKVLGNASKNFCKY